MVNQRAAVQRRYFRCFDSITCIVCTFTIEGVADDRISRVVCSCRGKTITESKVEREERRGRVGNLEGSIVCLGECSECSVSDFEFSCCFIEYDMTAGVCIAVECKVAFKYCDIGQLTIDIAVGFVTETCLPGHTCARVSLAGGVERIRCSVGTFCFRIGTECQSMRRIDTERHAVCNAIDKVDIVNREHAVAESEVRREAVTTDTCERIRTLKCGRIRLFVVSKYVVFKIVAGISCAQSVINAGSIVEGSRFYALYFGKTVCRKGVLVGVLVGAEDLKLFAADEVCRIESRFIK